MKFLVMGCNGMAGHTISLYLKSQGHEVFGVDRMQSKYVESVAGDARDVAFVKEIVGKNKYDSIINCIGILNRQAEENKSLAVYFNAFFPHLLADITSGTDTQVIHMSTDCVFSGNRGGYTEDDFRDGYTFYDRSKALGELEDGKNITLRNSIVGPDINENGIGLLNWFMKQDGSINGYTKAMWSGQTTFQLAKTMEAAAKEKAHGLYNAVPAESISKYGLLKLFNKYLKDGKVEINPVDVAASDKSLVRTRFDFNYVIPDYETMVAEMAEWIKAHKDMYPHYQL